MNGTITRRIALLAVILMLAVVTVQSGFSQLSVQGEDLPIARNVVAGSADVPVLNLCFVSVHEINEWNGPSRIINLRIAQVADRVNNRSVESVLIAYRDETGRNVQAAQELDNGFADFNLADTPVFIPANNYAVVQVYVALRSIGHNEDDAKTGDVLQFAFRANEGFRARFAREGIVESCGGGDIVGNPMCVRGNVPLVPELEVLQHLGQEDGSLANGLVEVLRFSVTASEGTDVALVKVPIRIHLIDSVINDALLYLVGFRVYEGNEPNNLQQLTEATSGEDAYAVWTANGRRVSRNDLLIYDFAISTHYLYVQFYDERVIPTGQTRYFAIRAIAGNVGTGARSSDSIGGYLAAEPLCPGTYYLDMHLDDEGEPQEEPLASLIYDDGHIVFPVPANDWVWSDMTGINGDFQHRQYGQQSSQDYILGLRVCFPPLPQTIFSVFGNEYDGRRDQMDHQAGEILGLWCGLSTDQIIGGIQFDLDVEGLVVDSVTIPDGMMEEQGFEAVSRNNRVLVLCPEGQALAGQALNSFVKCWVTLPEDAQGVYCILAENIIISSESGDPIGVDEVHQGWFFVGPAGDLNQDGELNILDLVRMIDLILDGYQVWEGRVGDMNGDWTLDVEDMVFLIDAILDGAGRDSPLLEPSEVWQGQLDDVWQYSLSNNQPVRAFQLTLRGNLENVQPYLTDRSEGMTIVYHYDPATRTMKLVVYSISEVIQPGQGAVMVVPGEVEEVIFEKVVQANPQGAPSNPLEGKPQGFLLQPAYPNPFNSRATIGYSLPTPGLVNLTIYDLSGREVTRLVNSTINAGVHTVTFDGQDLATGVYLLRLETPAGIKSQKLTLIK